MRLWGGQPPFPRTRGGKKRNATSQRFTDPVERLIAFFFVRFLGRGDHREGWVGRGDRAHVSFPFRCEMGCAVSANGLTFRGEV